MTVTAAAPYRVVRRPGTEVVSADPSGAAVRVALSDSTELSVDYIVFAAAIEPTCATSRTCNASLGQVELADGFPALDNAMQTRSTGFICRPSQPRGTSARSSGS
jgi:hypothetical protein